MIDYVKGQVVDIDAAGAVIDISGIGIRVTMPVLDITEMPAQNEPASLYLRAMVRDDSLSLYGFVSRERRDLFNLLITVPTVGPALAISMMSAMDADDIIGAILSEDHGRLSMVQGVGKKTSQKIVIELKDRLKKLYGEAIAYSGLAGKGQELKQDVIEALLALGFSRQDSIRACSQVFQASGKTDESLDNIIKRCLKMLGERGGKRY